GQIIKRRRQGHVLRLGRRRIRRVGEIHAAVPGYGQIVRAPKQLAIVVVDDDLLRRWWIDNRDSAASKRDLGDEQASFAVEGHAVRAAGVFQEDRYVVVLVDLDRAV